MSLSQRVVKPRSLSGALFNRVLIRLQSTLLHPKVTQTADIKCGNQAWEKAKPFSEIPGPKQLPVIGTAWQLLPGIKSDFDFTKIHLTHRKQYKKYGPVWKEVFPHEGTLVWTANPKDAEELYRNEGMFPVRPRLETLRVYRKTRMQSFKTAGLFAEHGEPWYRVRTKAQQPLLKPRNLDMYLEPLSDIADDFTNRIRDILDAQQEVPENFLDELFKWALESVAIVAFNTRVGCLDPNFAPDSEPQRMIRATNDALSALNQLELGFPFWQYIPTPTWRKFCKAQDFFTQTTLKYIDKVVEEIKQRPAVAEVEPNMLESLLATGLTKEETAVTVLDMLMAGIDTTSLALGFLMYYLATNPEKQEKLRQEILSTAPRGKLVTPETISGLPYLKACVKESFRLMPPVGFVGRYINKDMVVSGYRVPKGTMVVPMYQLMSRLEENFPQPDSFIPERWIKGHPLESNANPYVTLPFSFGSRMCVGRRLAEMEIWAVMIKVMQNFRIEYHYGEIGSYTRLLNVPDKPLKFKFVDISC